VVEERDPAGGGLGGHRHIAIITKIAEIGVSTGGLSTWWLPRRS
jgi:hypothetical protein